MKLSSFRLSALALATVTVVALPGLIWAQSEGTGAAPEMAAGECGGMGPGAGMGPGDGMGHGMGPGMGMGPMKGFSFVELDTDKDGKVTVTEINAFKEGKIKALDTNGDGKISAEEISAGELARMTERANARAAKMIKWMDTDGDGVLSFEEMAAGPMAGMMFERMDTEGDGAISQAEADAAKQMMQEHGCRGGHGKHKHGDHDGKGMGMMQGGMQGNGPGGCGMDNN